MNLGYHFNLRYATLAVFVTGINQMHTIVWIPYLLNQIGCSLISIKKLFTYNQIIIQAWH